MTPTPFSRAGCWIVLLSVIATAAGIVWLILEARS